MENVGKRSSQPTPAITRSNSSSASSVDLQESRPGTAARPTLGLRKSTNKVPRTEQLRVADEEDMRTMSPRRSSEDMVVMGEEAREELKRHAKALQDSLLTIFQHIEAVKEEHDKLDSNNKFLQKYIGDLMTTSKITATGGRAKK